MKAKTRTPVQDKLDPADKPWWRHGMVWLVISGPAVVVVAAIVTAVIAVRGADPVLDTRADRANLPAIQGRNHAATPPEKRP